MEKENAKQKSSRARLRLLRELAEQPAWTEMAGDKGMAQRLGVYFERTRQLPPPGPSGRLLTPQSL
jgi:hypothetical protein